MEIALDEIDYKILKILNENARLSYAEISRNISLSQSATKERIRNLIDVGIIKQFKIDIDFGKLGYQLNVIISLKFKNDEFKKFIDDLFKFPEIINCKRVTGEHCLITECILRNSNHLENLIDRLIVYGIPTTSIQLSEINNNQLFSPNN